MMAVIVVVVYFHPLLCEVCPNHEVVVFLPQTLTTPHLGSCRLSLQYNLSLPHNLFPYTVSGSLFTLISYRLPICIRYSSKPSYFTRYPLPLLVLSAVYLGVAPHPPSASLCRSSLRPAPRACVCCRSCAGALPPLPTSACTQVPVGPWGVLHVQVHPRLYVPASSSPRSPPNTGIVRFLVSCWLAFCARERYQGASITWKLRALALALPATWKSRRRSGYPDPPPPLPSSTSPPCRHDPIPVGRRSVGCSALSRCSGRY